MISSVFFSGQYRSWTVSKTLNPGRRGQRRVACPGLAEALANRFRHSVVIILNGKILHGWKIDANTIILPELLHKGTYYINIKITYNYLERAVYS